MDHWLCVTPVSVILRHPAPTQWPIIQRNSLRSVGRHRAAAKWWLVGSLSQPGLNHFSNHMLTSDKRWHWCQSVDCEAISVLQPLSDHNSISTSSSREIEYILVKPRRICQNFPLLCQQLPGILPTWYQAHRMRNSCCCACVLRHRNEEVAFKPKYLLCNNKDPEDYNYFCSMLVVEVVDKIVEKEEDKWPVLIYGVMFRDIFSNLTRFRPQSKNFRLSTPHSDQDRRLE